MKRSLFLILLCCSLFVAPALIQAQGTPPGFSVSCDDGTTFTNGVEVIAHQMRVGYDYTATAIGLNGFDPVLAVLDAQTGNGLCNDDSDDASTYALDLPTTGLVPGSTTSAQKTFTPHGSNGFEDISLVVGGYGDQNGEFVLLLDGMGVTSGDGAGDPFSVNLTPGMVNSGIPLTVYMIAEHTDLDPFIFQADSKDKQVKDGDGNFIGCDDAGDANSCWGLSNDLSNSSVTDGSTLLPGGSYDAMISAPLDGLQLNDDRTQNYYNFLMSTSPQNATTGQYLLVFDIGTSDTANTGKSSGGSDNGGQNTSGDTGSATGGEQSSSG